MTVVEKRILAHPEFGPDDRFIDFGVGSAMVMLLKKPAVDLFDAYHTIRAIEILVILFKTVHKIHHFEIRKICSYSDDAGTAIRAHESSQAGFAGSRAKADGAIRMKTNRRRSIRDGRRFQCLYRKTGNLQAIRINPVKQISFTDSGIFE